ncbi:MAG: hypothetical protein AB8F95_09615 [Bacteroidia bacterium]
MKLTYTIALLLAALWFSACTDAGTTKNKTGDTAQSDAVNVEKGMELGDAEYELLPSEITQAVAHQRITNFLDTVNMNPAKTFVHGFRLNHGDIKALEDDNDIHNADTIYAMLGYNTDSAFFDLVFCIETPKNSGTYRYFDFTQPCPQFCPGYLGDPNPPALSAVGDREGYWFGGEGMVKLWGIAEGENVESYLMLADGEWDSGIHLEVCIDNCDAPIETQGAYFAPCNTTDTIPCYSFN